MQPEEKSAIFTDQRPAYASFWERFGASFIDGLIVSAAGFGLKVPFGLSWMDSSVTYAVCNLILGWLYSALQESGRYQATLGKRALNLQVVNEQGQRISFGQATVRHFAKWLSLITLCIGYLMVLWDSRRQALHDKVANTFVITKPNGRW